jgi:hypothetical protein
MTSSAFEEAVTIIKIITGELEPEIINDEMDPEF